MCCDTPKGGLAKKKQQYIVMYYEDTLPIVQVYPSPDGIWELVEKIGMLKLMPSA